MPRVSIPSQTVLEDGHEEKVDGHFHVLIALGLRRLGRWGCIVEFQQRRRRAVANAGRLVKQAVDRGRRRHSSPPDLLP